MSGFVYFIGAATLPLGSVKIGFTGNDPLKRRANLQCGSAQELILMVYTDGTEAMERELHHQFGDLRKHGEWFTMSGPLLKLIGHMVAARSDLRGYVSSGDYQEAYRQGVVAGTWADLS